MNQTVTEGAYITFPKDERFNFELATKQLILKHHAAMQYLIGEKVTLQFHTSQCI